MLDAYLLPPREGADTGETLYGRASFATTPLRDLKSARVKAWYDGLPYGRTTEKLLMIVRAIFAHARSRGWIDHDPTAGVERQEIRYSGDYDFFAREEVDALVRAAASEQDAAIYLTAAMTGLRRGELVALRWRDVDFPGQAIRVRANYSFGQLVTPKSGKVRSVPMVPEVAQALAKLGQRRFFLGDEDPVFAGPMGGHLDASALRRRYSEAVKRGPAAPPDAQAPEMRSVRDCARELRRRLLGRVTHCRLAIRDTCCGSVARVRTLRATSHGVRSGHG